MRFVSDSVVVIHIEMYTCLFAYQHFKVWSYSIIVTSIREEHSTICHLYQSLTAAVTIAYYLIGNISLNPILILVCHSN